MADSEWESIRKKSSNRIRYGIGIGIPVVLLAGFLFYNNRDLFNSSILNEDAVKQSDTTLEKSLPDSIAGNEVKHISVKLEDSTVKKTDSVTVSVIPEIKKTDSKKAFDKSSGKKIEVIDIPVTATTMPGSSLELSSVRCHTADKNGPILDLSVELKSAQGAIEKNILIMRDELRVLIQNVVRSKEVNTLSREQLKTEIIQSVNKYIGKDVFNELKFTEFKVEKVINK
jgi:hypothetical protein